VHLYDNNLVLFLKIGRGGRGNVNILVPYVKCEYPQYPHLPVECGICLSVKWKLPQGIWGGWRDNDFPLPTFTETFEYKRKKEGEIIILFCWHGGIDFANYMCKFHESPEIPFFLIKLLTVEEFLPPCQIRSKCSVTSSPSQELMDPGVSSFFFFFFCHTPFSRVDNDQGS